MSDGLLVRAAERSDLSRVAEIYGHYVLETTATFELEPPDLQQWQQRWSRVSDAGLPFLVGELGGVVRGYAYCSPWKPRPAYRGTVENSIYVDWSATGHGLGRALIERLLTDSASRGVREVIAVISDPGEPGSAVLHRKVGFVEVGRLRGVGLKFGRRLDTVLMQRSLAEPRALA